MGAQQPTQLCISRPTFSSPTSTHGILIRSQRHKVLDNALTIWAKISEFLTYTNGRKRLLCKKTKSLYPHQTCHEDIGQVRGFAVIIALSRSVCDTLRVFTTFNLGDRIHLSMPLFKCYRGHLDKRCFNCFQLDKKLGGTFMDCGTTQIPHPP